MGAVQALLRAITPNALLTQYYTLVGAEFEINWEELAVPALGGVAYLRLVSPADKYMVLNYRQLVMDQERGFYEAFGTFTFDQGAVGDDVVIQKLRVGSALGSGSVAEKLTAITSLYVTSRNTKQPLFGTAGQGNNIASGDLNSESSIKIIPPNSEFLLRFTNESELASYFSLNLKWYEISEKSLPHIRSL